MNMMKIPLIIADKRTNINKKNRRTDKNGRTDRQTDTYTHAYDV